MKLKRLTLVLLLILLCGSLAGNFFLILFVRKLYGDRHHFAISNRPGGGVQVHVEIPFRANVVAESNGHATDPADWALAPG